MYNTHFNFTNAPFTLTPDTHFFCHLKPHDDALQTILISLRNNEGFVKITGPVGVGKTMLCRQLLTELNDDFTLAYIPNPTLSTIDLYKVIIHELEGDLPENADSIVVYNTLNALLLRLKTQDKRVVLIIDEAQALSDEGLEAIRLLTNLETKTHKLLQIVLFGQLELDERLNSPKFLSLLQRIIFSYQLMPLSKMEFCDYIQHRLLKAGYMKHQLFDQGALNMIYKSSKGVPRMANILAHKALIAAFSQDEDFVNKKSVCAAVQDTMGITKKSNQFFMRPNIVEWTAFAILLVVLIGVIFSS